jgi:hypothetical protein
MKFPIANISIKNWNPEEDILLYILLNKYIYRDDNQLYQSFFYNKEFVDSNGDIYLLVDQKKSTSLLRKIFKFLPNVFKIELIFKKTKNKMDIENVREFIQRQIGKMPKDANHVNWIEQIKNAKKIQEILDG